MGYMRRCQTIDAGWQEMLGRLGNFVIAGAWRAHAPCDCRRAGQDQCCGAACAPSA